MGKYSVFSKSNICFALLVFTCSLSLRSAAGDCTSGNIDILKELMSAAAACDSHRLFELGAAVDEQAMPEFKTLLDHGSSYCPNVRRNLRTILAKLGDRTALESLEQELNQNMFGATLAIADLGIVGNDDAIAALVFFVKRHEDAPAKERTFLSGGDVVINPLGQVSNAMRKIAMRRRLKNFPQLGWNEGAGDYRVWSEWWDNRQSGPISVAVFEDVSDVRMRCLARKVEWGFPDAILEMGSLDDPVAESILRRFPRHNGSQSIGTIEGNLEAALARLGDEKEFRKIFLEVRTNPSIDAVNKLAYIGGAKAVEALIDALRRSAAGAVTATSLSKMDRRKLHLSYNDQILIDRNNSFQKSILKALARMVVNPPLSATADCSTENIQKWIDWWSRNKDAAQFVKFRVMP